MVEPFRDPKSIIHVRMLILLGLLNFQRTRNMNFSKGGENIKNLDRDFTV